MNLIIPIDVPKNKTNREISKFKSGYSTYDKISLYRFYEILIKGSRI